MERGPDGCRPARAGGVFGVSGTQFLNPSGEREMGPREVVHTVVPDAAFAVLPVCLHFVVPTLMPCMSYYSVRFEVVSPSFAFVAGSSRPPSPTSASLLLSYGVISGRHIRRRPPGWVEVGEVEQMDPQSHEKAHRRISACFLLPRFPPPSRYVCNERLAISGNDLLFLPLSALLSFAVAVIALLPSVHPTCFRQS